jgi:hypothetical protein
MKKSVNSKHVHYNSLNFWLEFLACLVSFNFSFIINIFFSDIGLHHCPIKDYKSRTPLILSNHTFSLAAMLHSKNELFILEKS